jgi:hypothetical protein
MPSSTAVDGTSIRQPGCPVRGSIDSTGPWTRRLVPPLRTAETDSSTGDPAMVITVPS